ncbi:MAG: triose-phosphate isomerase [Desulfobacteraceae bacterium]|nr:MAG: triose-phosphate isomerase [Desulfobacteraceae bacterium]
MVKRTPLIAGNWKMNLNLAESDSLIASVGEAIGGLEQVEVLVAPPFTSLAHVKKSIGRFKIFLAGQNMHEELSGAFTGEISAAMLLEAGCTHVILGHSERRSLFQETDQRINNKAVAAIKAGLVPIVCIGETLEEREAGRTFEIVRTQLNGSLRDFKAQKQLPKVLVLAYEPVWAIGTGKTASPEQAQEVHLIIRAWLKEHFGGPSAEATRILYGGSVKSDNIKELMAQADIDGALVGGASLKAGTFIPIIKYQ